MDGHSISSPRADDALIVINLCRLRQLDYVNQRVGEADRERLIRSGSVFVFDENAAGIKRWTDGLAWSPSRICNNFLVYRCAAGLFPLTLTPLQRDAGAREWAQPVAGA